MVALVHLPALINSSATKLTTNAATAINQPIGGGESKRNNFCSGATELIAINITTAADVTQYNAGFGVLSAVIMPPSRVRFTKIRPIFAAINVVNVNARALLREQPICNAAPYNA